MLITLSLSIIPATASSSDLTAMEKQEILDAHNRYRSEVNLTSLNWSENLSRQAQQCADYNAATTLAQGRQKHCPKSGFGQNIALATASLHRNLTQKVSQWGAEKKNFLNGEYPSVSVTGNPGDVSHYTQMIWQETELVGCAKNNSSGIIINTVFNRPVSCYSISPVKVVQVAERRHGAWHCHMALAMA